MNKLIGFILISPFIFIITAGLIYNSSKQKDGKDKEFVCSIWSLAFLLFIWSFYFFSN